MNNLIVNCNSKYIEYPWLVIIFLLILTWIFYSQYKKTFFNKFGFLLVLIGGFLNLGEWLFRGCVLDYIRLFSISVYNINDLLIMIGLGMLLIGILYEKN